MIQITVDDTTDGASVATVRLRDEGGRLSDGTKFKVGSALKVSLGHAGRVKPVFEGEVTGWKGTFPRRGNAVLTVIAHDKFHRLRRNRRQTTFANQKDSDVIAAAAQAAGLQADVTATSITQEALLQLNHSDADFILERASLFGYEAFVDGNKLVCRPPDLAASPVATLEWHDKLRHFVTGISLARQQKEVKVTTWSVKDKVMRSASSLEGDERDLMGGTKPGANVIGAVDPAVFHAATTPAETQEEAAAYAKALFQKRSERFLEGEGACEGDPNIRRGTVVEILGIGQYLAGNYYVRRAIHTLLPGSGYTTSFLVTRSAVQAPAPPPATYEREAPAAEEPHEVEPDQDPLAFEVAAPDGAPLGGVPAVIVDGSGQRHAVELTSDGRVDVEFEES